MEIEIVDIVKIKVIKFKDLKVGDLILYSCFRSRVVEITRQVIKIEQFAFEEESIMHIGVYEFYYKIIGDLTTKKEQID